MPQKILIVDDDPDIREAMSLVLEGAGYEVVMAGSAEKGLSKVQSDRPDIIILDVMMPDG
ncbi:MAG: response regulator, partial [Armatimonadetes bacterium]|nr:response regulator [Armatimonadota bacterium]